MSRVFRIGNSFCVLGANIAGSGVWVPPVAEVLTGFPTKANTGVLPGVIRTAYSGSYNISGNNVTIENQNISGQLNWTGNDGTLRNCLITYSSFWGGIFSGQRMKIINCTFVGPGESGESDSSISISSGGLVERCQTSGSENGIRPEGSGWIIRDNYIGELRTSKADPHADGIALHGGQSNGLIENNTILSWSNANVFLKNDSGTITSIIIRGNLLLVDPNAPWFVGYNLRLDGNSPNHAPPSNCSVLNNVIERGYFGYFVEMGPGHTFSGNRVYNPSAPDFKGALI